MGNCETPKFVDPETQSETLCREMPPPEKASRELLDALKKEFVPNFAKEFRDLTNNFFLTENPEEKEKILTSIENIASEYSNHPAFIEMMGYFSLRRFALERNPFFLLTAAHKVGELSKMNLRTKGEEGGLREDFYGKIFNELADPQSPIRDLLPRILQILGNGFAEWLSREVRERNDTQGLRGQKILERYIQYKNARN